MCTRNSFRVHVWLVFINHDVSATSKLEEETWSDPSENLGESALVAVQKPFRGII